VELNWVINNWLPLKNGEFNIIGIEEPNNKELGTVFSEVFNC